MEMHSYGLIVMPLSGAAGKEPFLNFGSWRPGRAPGKPYLAKLIRENGASNIAILAGLSGYTVADLGASVSLEAMLDRFGDTPLIIRTPRGGYHLWYKNNGERCSNLRCEGLDVDIKGQGGYVAGPPSVRLFDPEEPDDPYVGNTYRFERGSWADLKRLPPIKPGSLPGSTLPAVRNRGAGVVMPGERNDKLFLFVKDQARGCDAIEQLQDCADGWNECLPVPLPAREVAATVASVWKYKLEGRLWNDGKARAVADSLEFEILRKNLDAHGLRTLLQLNHGARQEPFSVVCKAMHRDRLIPGWGVNKYRAALKWLISEGFLEVVHEGGTKKGDYWQFRLATPAFAKGSVLEPNIIKHPPLVNIGSDVVGCGRIAA
jgi:hypothetical protein